MPDLVRNLDVETLRKLVGRDAASTPQLLAARVAATPDALFVRSRGVSFSYVQGWREVGRFAGWVATISPERGRPRIASFLTNCEQAVWCTLGTHLAGCTYVPLNRGHRGDLLRSLLERSLASILVTERSALADLPDLASCGIRHVLLVDGPDSGLPGWDNLPEPGNLTDFPEPGDIATVMFTSGTTGRSKAVRIPHNMLCRGAARVVDSFGFRSSDVVHLWMPLFHIAAQLHKMTAMIIAGGALAIFPTFSRTRFWDEVRDSSCTVFGGLPNVLNFLWSQPPRPEDREHTLRLGLIGMIPPELHRDFEARFGVRLLDTYGMTEAEPLTLPDLSRELPLGSCGQVGPDFDLRVVDDTGRFLSAGEQGEIVARPLGPNLMMQGYEGDDAATVGAWRDLWWHTGDLGYLDSEGFVYVKGRIKQMIRKGGENISSWELEAMICAHEAVQECAVLAVPSPLGEDEVKAVIIKKDGTDLDAPSLHEYCSGKMAKFMVPRFIEFVSELPLNDVGKVDKLKLVDNSEAIWDSQAMRESSQ